MIVGPCSVHNLEDALTYAERLRALAGQVRERILLVMRVYFEKPRTSLGWKGLIYDPELDNSAKIALGLRLARKIMLEIVSMGVLTASELLDPVIPQYITDLLCWAAIGARTVESQTHRQMASGLSMPIGVKNSTDGNVAVAIHAIKTAASPHTFIGIMEDGRVGVFHTRGNPFGHLVLRGGHNGPNYGTEYIAFARELMRKARITPNIVVDCSHDNSRKQPERQIDVMRDAIRQIIAGDRDIVGTMLESNLIGGRQNIPKDLRDLKPGVSITDACMGWGETEALITEAYEALGEPSREMVQPIESR
jgi:3-deoxy-7-phosphoheptulonate synthase